MKTIHAALICFICFFGTNVKMFSQIPSGIERNKEYQLKSVSPEITQSLSGKAESGGKYFVLMGELYPAGGFSPMVHFELVSDSGGAMLLAMGRDKFLTVIDDSKSVPTAAWTGPGYDKHPWHWTVRISKKDFQTAYPCLPKIDEHKKYTAPWGPSPDRSVGNPKIAREFRLPFFFKNEALHSSNLR